MNPVSAIVLVILIIVMVIAVFAFMAWVADRPERLPSPQKAELKALRATIRRIEVLAAQNKGINDADSILASQIEDEIYNYKTKELP
jgi:biopolymer transport protein ExbD